MCNTIECVCFVVLIPTHRSYILDSQPLKTNHTNLAQFQCCAGGAYAPTFTVQEVSFQEMNILRNTCLEPKRDSTWQFIVHRVLVRKVDISR